MTVIWMEEDGRPAGRDNVSHRHRGGIVICRRLPLLWIQRSLDEKNYVNLIYNWSCFTFERRSIQVAEISHSALFLKSTGYVR